MSGAAAWRFGRCSLIAVAFLTAQPSNRLAAQQVAPNRADDYLFPTTVQDARAIWVNPARLGAAGCVDLRGIGGGGSGVKRATAADQRRLQLPRPLLRIST